ncbi:MAG: T9SS type A sorting domain-containing protein [Reichenbachiella sp.]|uniref:T9SS type A sorting domain-containing protein n=1 Tax=Reichenbachiella sp. TaxID=2184521 RepID=UPI0032995CA1
MADNGVDVIDVGDTKLIRVDRMVNDGMTDFIDGSYTFTVHPQPTIDITTVGVTNVSDNFCSSNMDVTISGTVTNDAGSPALTITTYEIRQVTPVATAFESIAATHIDFEELLNHTGIYAGISATTAGEGLYEIRVTSDAGDDAYGNPPGCTNMATAQFNLFAKPNTPTIALVGGVDPGAQETFEFCEDAIPFDFNLDLQGGTIAASERFEWDDDNMFGSPISLAGIGSTAELADVGINATPGANDFVTTTRYVRRIGFESSPFAGCVSDPLTITTTVYQTQETPELVTYTSNQDASPSPQAQSDGSILLEYCVGDPLTVLQADVTSFSGDNAMATHRYFNWYYDNTGDGVPETYINNTDEFLDVVEMDGVFAAISNDGTTAFTPGTYTFGFTQTDFDTGAGSGSFMHNGCETGMRTIDIEIKTTPSDIVLADGFTTEYFTCEGSAIVNITTANQAGIIYTWYGDDGDGVDEIGGADGAAIKEGTFIDDSELTSSGINGYDNSMPGTSYFWITRKTDRNGSTGFDGCESAPVLLAATVNENYNDMADLPNFDPDGPGALPAEGAGADVVLYFCNDELSATDVFSASSTYDQSIDFSSLAEMMVYDATKKFNWYTSDAGRSKNALLSNASGDDAGVAGSVITAQELFLVGKPNDDQNYFLLTQTTDILDNGSVNAGCEGDGILIEVNTYNIPAAPIENKDDAAGTLTDFYYCENDPVATLEVEGEDENPGNAVTFYWYQTEADALLGVNRIPTTNDASGKTILASELTPDETDFDGMAVTNLGGSPAAGDYSFWFTQTTDIGAFTGCESLPTEVTIHILETPLAPTVSAVPPVCDVDDEPIVSITNANPGDLLRWYEVSGEDPLVDTEIHESTFSLPFLDTEGDLAGIMAPTWTKTFYLYRVENSNIDGLGFAGCANPIEVPVDVTVYPKPASPSTSGINANNKDIFAYCKEDDISGEVLDIDMFEVSDNDVTQFKWYSTNPDGLSLTPFLQSANTVAPALFSNSFTFTQIANNSDVNILTADSTRVFVTQVTNGLCESDSYPVDIIVNELPTVDIVDFGTVSDFTTAYCNDNGVVTLQGKGEGVDYTGPNDLWTIDTGGLTEPSNLGLFDPNAAASAAGQGPFGTSTNHQITYAYTKDYTAVETYAPISCTSEITKTITVHGIPDIDIENNTLVDIYGNNLTDDGAIEICESEGSFTINGVENQGKGGSGTYTITGGINTSGGSIDEQIGTGGSTVIFPSELGDAIEVSDNTLLEHDFGIRFDFTTTTGSCSNSITKTVTVNVLPEVQFEVDGGCIDPDVNFNAELRFPATSPYALSNDAVATGNNLVLTWKYYYANSAGLPNLSDPYGSTTDLGINVDETFDLQGEETGTFAAILTATTELGCQSVVDVLYTQKPVNILIDPSISFKWNGVTAGEQTEFIYRETLLNLAQVSQYAVSYEGGALGTYEPLTPVVQSGLEVDGVSVYDPFYHTFTDPGKYDVALVLESTNTCYDTLLHNVNIIPLIDVASLPDARFEETFDVGTFDPDVDGWYVERLKDDALSIVEFEEVGTLTVREHSWKYGTLDLEGLGLTDGESPGDLASALTGAWSTTLDNNHYLSNEDSWLYTPAFDISGLDKPMVQFNMIYDFAVNQDGVVLQYSIDQGSTWAPLGSYTTDTDVSTGLEWYNFDNVQADPGQQSSTYNALTAMGWSGEVSKPKWVSARHRLDAIPETDRGHVRFRFAIAGTEQAKDGYFGFALDDFTIQERSKNVMIEQFVSASDDDGAAEVNDPTVALKAAIDGIIPSASVTSRDEVILAYHSDFGFNDPFNLVNPAGPSARSIYYNVDKVTSILDGQLGGNSSSAKSGDLTWSENDLNLNSLKDPGFEIILTPDPTASPNEVKGSVEFVANQDYAIGTELRAYVVILEDTVEQSVAGISGFGHVMRKLLPSGSGKYVKLTEELSAENSLLFGEETEMKVSWSLANIADDANLSAIVFIQNSKTKEIYQSVKIDNVNDFVANKNSSTVTDIKNEVLTAKDFKMYPNPTDHEVFIIFDKVIQEDMHWAIFDQTGRVFDQGEIHSGKEGFSLQTDRFPSGLYYMSIKGEKKEFDFKKLMITH